MQICIFFPVCDHQRHYSQFATFEIIFIIVILRALGPLKLLHAICIFIHKKLHFRKYLVKKICVVSIICLIFPFITSEPVYLPSLALVVFLRWALDLRREDTWFSVAGMQQHGLQKSLLQRLEEVLFGVQGPYNHKAVLSHCNRNSRYLGEAFCYSSGLVSKCQWDLFVVRASSTKQLCSGDSKTRQAVELLCL